MKKLYLNFFLLFIAFNSFAQQPGSLTPIDTSWKKGGFINVNTSQVSLSNWAAGGQNSFALGSALNLFANYAKGDIEWGNALSLGYAEIKTGEETRKSDDKIDFVSKFGKKAFDHWYVSLLGNFKSQFANGFNYPNDSVVVSHFLAPGYVLVSLGMDYKPNDIFSLFLSPATGRFVIVHDQHIADLGTFGNDPAVYGPDGNLISHGKELRSEFGAYIKIAYKKEIMQNVTLLAKADLFNNYTDKDADNRKNVVVNAEATLDMKVNKFLAASINVVTIYDNNVDTNPDAPGVQRRLQTKEVLGIGLSYKF